MADFQRQGYVRWVGVSGVTLDQLRRARAIVRVDAVENRFNLLDRQGSAVLAECEAHNIAFTPYHPLGNGALPGESPMLRDIARRRNATPAQIALAWLLRRSPAVVCIPGTRSIAHLEENVAAAALANELTDDDLTDLEELVPEEGSSQ
jgi:aryl-alcohol dehydrogenase-like predicted oxidoreductase